MRTRLNWRKSGEKRTRAPELQAVRLPARSQEGIEEASAEAVRTFSKKARNIGRESSRWLYRKQNSSRYVWRYFLLTAWWAPPIPRFNRLQNPSIVLTCTSPSTYTWARW